jgi:hypothetical protein
MFDSFDAPFMLAVMRALVARVDGVRASVDALVGTVADFAVVLDELIRQHDVGSSLIVTVLNS